MPKYFIVHNGRHPFQARKWGQMFRSRMRADQYVEYKAERGVTVHLWEVRMSYVGEFGPEEEDAGTE